MQKYFIILFMFILYNCSSDNEKIYTSKEILSYQLLEVDSIRYNYHDDNFIGAIADIKYWKDYIVISDRVKYKLWIFDNNLNLIKEFGRYGNGPGEYSNAPFILTSIDTLYLLNYERQTIDVLDNNFDYLYSKRLPTDYIYYFFYLVLNDKFILCASKPFTQNMEDYYKNNQCLLVLDNKMQVIKEFMSWDEYYLEQTAHTSYNQHIFLSQGDNNTFFTQQAAVNKIFQYNENFEIINSFQFKPKFYKEPPKDMKIEDVAKSIEALDDFYSKTTSYYDINFDEHNQFLYCSYLNSAKNDVLNLSYKNSAYFLLVFNKDNDIIYDGPTPGQMVFVKDGLIYILTDEKPEYFQLKIFKLVEKN